MHHAERQSWHAHLASRCSAQGCTLWDHQGSEGDSSWHCEEVPVFSVCMMIIAFSAEVSPSTQPAEKQALKSPLCPGCSASAVCTSWQFFAFPGTHLLWTLLGIPTVTLSSSCSPCHLCIFLWSIRSILEDTSKTGMEGWHRTWYMLVLLPCATAAYCKGG